MKQTKSLGISILVILGYVGMIVVNALANIIPIGGSNTGAISDNYTNLFAPAGLTFSIWGIIYLALAVYCVYQYNHPNNTIGLLFIINSLANLLWIFAWHYHRIGISVLLMLVLLLSLITINLKLKALNLAKKAYIAMHLPFSLYFGWICVATIANITTLLVALDWKGWGLTQATWTTLVLVVGLIIAAWWALTSKDIPYLMVFIWAYLGILIKHISSTEFANAYPLVIATTSVCLLSFLILLSIIIYRKK